MLNMIAHKNGHLINALKHPTPVKIPMPNKFLVADMAILVQPKIEQELKKEELSSEPDEVFVAASRARWSDGQVAFDVAYGTSKTREPITMFMDLEEACFINKQVADTVNHWIKVAKNWPNIRRNCVCCKNKATKGKVLCKHCHYVFGETIYA